jgi:formylglycine-generating enzyme required for sulfatase activity
MPRWFLSYHSPDQVLAQRLKTAIERKDASSRVFFAPTHLRAGGSWSAQLAQEIAEADAFILLVGEAGIGNWQVPEYHEAHDRWVNTRGQFPLVVVLLEGQSAPGLPFLRQLHWIVTPDPASAASVGRIFDAAAGDGGRPEEPWRYTSPYRGLAAMTEADADFFFGRGDKTVEVIKALEATPDKLPVLLGNSGVGKSSLAQAGVLAALVRQAWPETAAAGPWPHTLGQSRGWCVLTLKPGTEPVRALVEPFIRIWQFDPTDPRRDTRLNEWIEALVEKRGTLRGLLNATEARLQEQGRSKPSAFLLYIDQGEELYVRAEARQRRRFSELLPEALADPRLRALMSLRADFFGELLNDAPLQDVSRKIEVPPLREAQLLEVVSKPAALLGARFENEHLAGDIAQRAAEESSKDAGALPLLSYLLDDMWKSKDPQWDGILRLPAPAIELGRVLVDRANAFIATHPGSEEALRRIFTLKLATVREDGEPTRRRAYRSEFSDTEWRLVSELADHPNRLLVTATAEEAPMAPAATANASGATATGETYAEVAHEAIFRRWDKLREWIAAEREFLAWRSGLEAARRTWEATQAASRPDALLMGAALTQAQKWFAQRVEDLPAPDRDFIAQSIAREQKAQARARFVRASIYGLGAVVILGLVGVIEQEFLKAQWLWWTSQRWFVSANVWPYALTPQAEQALKPGDNFRECAPRQQNTDYCPDMVVVPAGAFAMGSPQTDKQANTNEFPQHQVTIAKPFAVSKFELTFAEWDACVAGGGCSGYKPPDLGWGREEQPVMNVNWDDAQQYVAWLSKMTGKSYRLLSEAEYEYAARAGTTTEYPWGDEIGNNNANCNGCGSTWDNTQTAPVGSLPPNKFGLYDMVGNVWEWTEDCYQPNYQGAPTDGSAWIASDTCRNRVVRGGSWGYSPDVLRSANRTGTTPDGRSSGLGFRVARTLTP